MGRGLSEQQRAILSLGVAHNAARHGDDPVVQSLVADSPEGTKVRTMFGEFATRQRRVLVAGWPELSESFLLVALCGFRRERGYVDRWVEPAWRRRPSSVAAKRWRRDRGIADEDVKRDVYQASYRRYGGVKWRPETVCHKRRVSVMRSLEALVDRELVAYSPGPKAFESQTNYRTPEDRSHWNADELRAGELHAAMPEDLRAYWARRDVSRRYVLLPEAFEVVGESWRSWSLADVLEHWEQAGPVRRSRVATAV